MELTHPLLLCSEGPAIGKLDLMQTKRRYAKGHARREEILDTALRVIAENGYHGTSLRGIGRELGMQPANILHYFDSREDLLREVIELWDATNLEAARAGADALQVYVDSIRRNLTIRGVVHLYLAFAAEAVDKGHPAHDFFRDRFALSVRELSAALTAGQEAGQVRNTIDPGRAARAIIALCDGLQLQSLVDPAVDAIADLEAAIDDLFVSGERSPIARPARLTRTA